MVFSAWKCWSMLMKTIWLFRHLLIFFLIYCFLNDVLCSTEIDVSVVVLIFFLYVRTIWKFIMLVLRHHTSTTCLISSKLLLHIRCVIGFFFSKLSMWWDLLICSVVVNFMFFYNMNIVCDLNLVRCCLKPWHNLFGN